MKDLKKAKQDYLEEEIWILPFAGGLGRSSTYWEDATSGERKTFREAVKKRIRGLVETKYGTAEVSSDEHTSEITDFVRWSSQEFSDVLAGGRLRVGVAQKIFNLYLKYLWCADQIPEPPHCPFDRIVVHRHLNVTDVNWTEMDEIEDYERLVRRAQEVAQEESKSVAQWELHKFRRRENG